MNIFNNSNGKVLHFEIFTIYWTSFFTLNKNVSILTLRKYIYVIFRRSFNHKMAFSLNPSYLHYAISCDWTLRYVRKHCNRYKSMPPAARWNIDAFGKLNEHELENSSKSLEISTSGLARSWRGAEESILFLTRTCRRSSLAHHSPSRNTFFRTSSIVYFLSLCPRCALARRARSAPWRVISTPVDQSSWSPPRHFTQDSDYRQASISL